MADFQLKVSAETQDAEKKLENLDRAATEATKQRQLKIEFPNYSDLSKNFSDLQKDTKDAVNSVKQFYRVAAQLPVGPIKDINEMAGQLKSVAVAADNTRKNVGDAGEVIQVTLNYAGKAAETLVSKLTRVAFSLYVINQAAKAAQEAFSGMFKETIGREIQLRETILKTQTTLASTNKVFRNGKEITDPYQKIVSLTDEVSKHIDSIRERSIALAGVTSNDVIEVFGIVASQVGQIGGGLKEAEDLAINFAAALGTFGIPLYQARQEIGSILRGDITMDSYLAKSLGITNNDIAKAKTQVGGVVKFLEDRLSASVAGQRIAAEGFKGVISNIKDISELINQSFGRGLLDPLIEGLTKVFNFVFGIRRQLFSVAELTGRTIGTIASMSLGLSLGASGVSKGTEEKTQKFIDSVGEAIQKVASQINSAIKTVYLQIATLVERIAQAFTGIAKGIANLAMGLLSIKLEQFKMMIGTLEAVSPALVTAANALSGFLGLWGQFMKLPLVQEIAQLATGMRILELTGVTPLIRSGFILQGVLANWSKVTQFVITQFNALRAIIGGAIAWIGGVGVAAAQAGARMLAAWAPQGKALQALKNELSQVAVQLGVVGNAAQVAGSKIGSLEQNGTKLGKGIIGLIGGFIKFNVLMFAINATLSWLIERFSAWKEAQDKLASDRRAEEALRRLQTTYKNIGEAAAASTKRAKEFEEAIVKAKYDEAFEELKKIENELKRINGLLEAKAKTTVFDDLKAGTLALIENLGKVWNLLKLIASAKPIKFDKPEKNKVFGFDVRNLTDEGRKAVLEEREIEARKKVDRWARANDKSQIQDKINLEADKRINLEKEIADIRRQQDTEIFQQRQNLAQKEVDIFRAAGELRIFQMEQANKKLIEGEEGASAAALEALNNYISVRERGELEIESAKKQLVIEVANLERQIADYRLENEKKIAEIRKRAGENDQKIADYQRQSAGQIAAGSGGGAATFGSTGNVSNAPGWVHGHFQTYTGKLSDLIGDVIPVLKSLVDKGIPVELSDGTRVQGGKDDAYYRRVLTKSAQQHRHSGDGRSLDLFVPEGTKVPVPLTNISGNTGRGGITGGLPGSGKSWVGHLAPGSKAGGAGALVPPKLNDFSDIGAPAVAKYGDALRGVASAMERLRRIQEQLTGAKTKAAFEEIAKAAFKPVGLESYQDKLYELGGIMKSLADGTYDAFNPERSQIAAEQAAKQLSAQRELGQIEAGIRAQRLLSAQVQNAAIEAVRKTHQAFVLSLREEEAIRLRIAAISRIASTIQQFNQEIAQIERENEVIRLRNRLLMEGVSPEIIEQEVARLKRAQTINDLQKDFNALSAQQISLQNQLNEARSKGDTKKVAELEKKIKEQEEEIARLREQLRQAQERASSTKPETPIEQSKNPRDIINNRIGNLKRELADLTNWGNIAVKAADGIGTAFAEAFRSVVTGAASVQDALGNMFGRIGEMFIQMATEIIAKMLIMYALKALLGLFGGGGGGGASAPATGSLVFAAEGAYWTGGFKAFENGGLVTKPTMGLVGEGGEPEYIIPASKMSAAMQRYSAGARGSAVIPSSGATTEGDTSPVFGGTAVAGGIDVRFNVERINSVDYVTADQFQAGIRQAAQQGATQGEQRTLRRLQQSRSTRSRLGLT